MKLYLKILNLAYESIFSNAFRAFLTMLGIIIGGATIILVIEMGQGAKNDIDEQFSNMSVTTILINAPASEGGNTSKLDIDDIESINNLENVVISVPQLSGKVTVSSGNIAESFNILGSNTDIFPMMSVDFVKGEAFTDADEEEHNKVAVLGATVVEELFGDPEAKVVGEEIVLGKKTFTIVGTLKYKGGSFGPTSIDDSVFTPYSSAYRYVLGKKGKFNINATATDIDLLDQAMDDIALTLRENHNIKLGGIDDFRIKDMGSNVQAAKDSSKTMSLLLGSIGAIVLLVGGIGIMNIMYVTVTERTKEIGLRKAIGAKDKHIELQFLLEAILISIIGYFVGTILATI
ncbi:FtsX-like permease family protein, partial [Candidatus Falkowbacteria bacterium]|nr:FtsX-like permease family protein [Candidatus Falkowbacteria bacterium]